MRAFPVVAVCGTVLAAALVVAGPLTPPAGPVASTYKTLSEVEPRRPVQSLGANPPYIINQSGSYYLTGDINAVSGQKGIMVFADNVTIDLNGFSMFGNGVGDDAIYCDSRRHITVRNGTIRSWIKEGIDGFLASEARVERVTVDSCANGFGIILGDDAQVTDCVASFTGAGFILGSRGHLSGCTATQNNGPGFIAGPAASLARCTAESNTQDGFAVGVGANLSSCTARANAMSGFVVDSWGTLDGSTSLSNTQYGVSVTTSPGVTVGAMITGCNIAGNTWAGIAHNGVGATVRGCTISRNTSGAINLGSNSLVCDNTITENGTTSGDPPPAFQVTCGGTGSRVDNNHFVTNSGVTALYLVGADNLAVRNTFTGPGITISGNANNETALIHTNPGQNFSNTNAWANFKY